MVLCSETKHRKIIPACDHGTNPHARPPTTTSKRELQLIKRALLCDARAGGWVAGGGGEARRS